MSIYFVKTYRNRHLGIEADNFEYNRESQSYEFSKNEQISSGERVRKMVASIPYSGEILAIIKEDCSKADVYFSVVGHLEPQEDSKEKSPVPVVEYRLVRDETAWGFSAGDRFYPFDGKEQAENAAMEYAEGRRDYESVPLNETTPVPGVIQ